jgi:serine/threonine-protein kinase CHEK1
LWCLDQVAEKILNASPLQKQRHMDDCRIQRTLASGSTSKIKRLVTLENEEHAIKIIPKSRMALGNFVREVKIHRSLSHPNIVEYISSYEDKESYCLIMRLGDREMIGIIEANMGLEPVVAHFYFVQLISAVRYLHRNGICHRDIKPENILLDRSGNLLLSDFGSSTLFYHRGRRRRLRSLAGTFEYMAPEVIEGGYEGDLADIWSCGILLIVLLTGTLPWDRATRKDERYAAFISMRYHYYPPFTKMRGQAVDFIKKILVRESKRVSMEELQGSPWYRQENELLDGQGLCGNPARLLSLIPQPGPKDLHFTQPNQVQREARSKFVLSQPLNLAADAPAIHRLYREGGAGRTMERACEALRGMVVPHEVEGCSIMFATTDTKRLPLVGEVEIREVDGHTFVTLHKTKGDGHEFKRFVSVFAELLE